MTNIISFPQLDLLFKVNRVAFKIGNFEIYWYGLLIGLGLLIAIIYGVNEFNKVKLNTDDFFNMLLIALPVAITCARAYYVIFNWDLYAKNLLTIFDIRNGGLAIYGGIIGAVAVVIIYCKKKRIDIGIVLDILAIGLLIGQVVGRWGNFINGEAFGTSTSLPWGMTIEKDGKIIANSVHPTFLYESIWNIIGIAVLLMYKRIKKFNSEIFFGYILWYGIGRSLIEGLRSDSLYIGVFRVSQLLSLILATFGLITIIYKRHNIK